MCSCIQEVNMSFSKMGYKLDIPDKIVLDFSGEEIYDRVVVHMVNVETGEPTKFRLVAAFCPFCGEKYTPEIPMVK